MSLEKDLKSFNKLKSGHKTKIYLILFLFCLVGIVFGIIIVNVKPWSNVVSLPPNPMVEKLPAVSLKYPKTVLNVGETIKIDVVLENVSPDALDLVLKYNPEVFSVSNLVKGLYPIYPVLRADEKKGQIFISATYDPNSFKNKLAPPLAVASFNLFAKKTGPREALTFDSTKASIAQKGVQITTAQNGVTFNVMPLKVSTKR